MKCIMSFMFNPHPYNETGAVNHPNLSAECISSLKKGAKEIGAELSKILKEKTVIAFEGYPLSLIHI